MQAVYAKIPAHMLSMGQSEHETYHRAGIIDGRVGMKCSLPFKVSHERYSLWQDVLDVEEPVHRVANRGGPAALAAP